MLLQDDKGNLNSALSYSIREIIRNVVEHSRSSVVGYCAQYWPTRNRVEVGIVDNGQGIRGGLSGNPYLNLESDRHAILMSMIPGVSGVTYKGSHNNQYDVWENTGYGLYMTSRICQRGGGFLISSGDSAVELRNNQKFEYKCQFEGTAIRMEINTNRIGSIEENLRRFRVEGAATAKDIDGANDVDPDRASHLLRINLT
jgi:hypothetical protein